MRETLAKCVVVIGAGLALMVGQGCKKQAAPAAVQPVVQSARWVRPDFPVGPLPVEDVDTGAMPRVDRAAGPRQQVQPVQVQSAETEAAAAAVAQRQQDAALLERQQAASQRQQEELDQEIEQEVKAQQEMEAEPRIQDIPEVPLESAPQMQ